MADQDMTVWEERRIALCKTITQFHDSLPQKAKCLEAAPELGGAAAKASNFNNVTSVLHWIQKIVDTGAMAELPKLTSATTSRAPASVEEAELVALIEAGPYSNGNEAREADERNQEVKNLQYLIKRLNEFGEKQFDFFYDGFVGLELDEEGRPKHKDFLLNPSREFPPAYVLTATLNQIAEDLELLRRVADQRLSADLGPELRKADKLVWSALQPVVGKNKLVNDDKDPLETTVMTYFQKSASVRIIPYAPVALIGIPFTAPTVPRDYLAIPHEVGHYVYRYAKVRVDETGKIVSEAGKGELRSIPQTLGKILLGLPEPSPRWARRWKEEIFADVYGCLIAGPVIALSFRDMSRQTSRTPVVQTPAEALYGQFTEDDGVHPVPALRPYVYTRVLENMIWGGIAKALNDEWEDLPQVKETTEFRTRYAGPSAEYIGLAEARVELYKIVDEVLKLLPVNELMGSNWCNVPDQTPVSGLYKTFQETCLEALLKNTQLKPKQLTDSDKLWDEWIKKENFFPGIDKPPAKNVAVIDPGKAHRREELEQEPRYTWNHVFLAGGWGTKIEGAHGSGVVYPKNWRGQNTGGGPGGY